MEKKRRRINIGSNKVIVWVTLYNVILMWGQFLLRPSVALVVIFGLESPTLERYISSFYLIRHELMVEEYHS